MVCKITHQNNAKLEREVTRIIALRENYPLMGELLAEVLGQGVIATGLHKNKLYFLQEFIEGPTLGQTLRSSDVESGEAAQLVSSITSKLMDVVEEHTFDPTIEGRSGRWMSEHLDAAYQRLQGLKYVNYLASLNEVMINGRARRSLPWCLRELSKTKIFQKLDAGPSIISGLGHWNFHSENIVLIDWPRSHTIRVFDPDVNIDACDPMFGIARLLYSLPHDTIEDGQYEIESDVFTPNAANVNSFDIRFIWPPQVMENYRSLLNGITTEIPFQPESLDQRFADPIFAARLELCLLLCLLRGVAANFEHGFWPLKGSLRTFRNNGIFLFLNVLNFANGAVERLKKYD